MTDARAYYNEHDKFCAEWLRNLIDAGRIPAGDVDTRDIQDVRPSDVAGYRQLHFFAGVGGWPLALRLAGWPDDVGCCTGSPPCQPFSSAGRGAGFEDERHLWPAFAHIISFAAPRVVFGEQVASPDGREWFARVRADLEGMGYACAGFDLCAAGVRAPHIRQRLYWVADADCAGWAKGYASAAKVGQGRPAEPSRDPVPWDSFEAHQGDDGKVRRVGAGTRVLADGFPNRLAVFRAIGNAINPYLAAEFVRAYVGA